MALLQNIDPDGLFEYSVVFTDRSLNHMSQNFQSVMKSLSTNLKKVYGAEGLALIPGGGTFGMEAIARQFANNQKCTCNKKWLVQFPLESNFFKRQYYF